MHLRVVCLGLAEYFTDEVDRSLHLVDVTRLVLFMTKTVLTMLVVAAMYKRRTSSSSAAVRTGGEVRKSLSSKNSLEASSFHSNLSDFRRSLKKGRPLSPSRLMNLLKAAMHPVNFIRSFLLLEGFMNLMALILVMLASMPRLLTMKLISFPDGTPNTHLVGLSFHLNFPRFSNVSERSVMN